MVKPLQDIAFFLMPDGIWRDVEGHILADVLANYDIIVDDRCQFARLYDYERKFIIYYRVYGGKITLTIHRMNESW